MFTAKYITVLVADFDNKMCHAATMHLGPYNKRKGAVNEYTLYSDSSTWNNILLYILALSLRSTESLYVQ